MMDDRKKYNGMENCLQLVSRKYISFSKEVEKRNNKILTEVLEPLIERMQQNKLFKQLYNTKFFGGSYYDGLKVGSPNEYDIDLLFKFPSSDHIEILTDTDTPGYVNLKLLKTSGFEIFCDKIAFTSYLDTKKVLQWMEGVVQKALNEMTMYGRWYVVGKDEMYNVRYIKGGPAFTLIVEGVIGDQEDMYIDLVPCFSFNKDKWPRDDFKYLGVDEEHIDLSKFFVVPKHPKGYETHKTKFWRLSFQIQERHLIKNLGRFKHALRLLKKMRDVQQHKCISSYFLKTVFLWEVEEHVPSFWSNNSLSYIFMYMLKRYQQYLSNREITYFWNENFNLLDGVEGDISNMSNRLRVIIQRVERLLPENPDVIAEYLLTPFERRNFTIQQGLLAEYETAEPSDYGSMHHIPYTAQKESSSCILL